MRGRKPVPTDLHKLRGTLNPTRHGKGRTDEPEALGELLPEPPDWMSEAQQAGRHYVVEHAPRDIPKPIDRGMLALWVGAEERHRTAAVMQAQLDQGTKLPLLTKTKDGTAVASPYLGIMNRAAALMLKAGSKLGFSPAARPRLAAQATQPAANAQSPWTRLKVIHGGKAAARGAGGLCGFDAALVEAALLFASQMPNIKGPEAGHPLRLMPWQKFVFANIFGFVERDTTTRRFHQAVVYVPRGNGKTTIAAPIGLYLTFVEGEGGAEGYAAAVTRDQARILFGAAQHMVRRSPEFHSSFGIGVGANAIYQENTASKFVPASSDAKALDGLNVQVAICDEIATHKTAEVYDVLLTAMGTRRHPLLLSISTATGNSAGIGKQIWDYVTRVLEEVQDDDRLFGLLHSIDPEDDPWQEATNPSWGQAVQPDAIRGIMRQARNNAAQEAVAKTRHLNIWVGADEALSSMRAWRTAADPALVLKDFEGQPCHLRIDLTSRTDLAALTIVFPSHDPNSGKVTYTAFARSYLNEDAVMKARNPSYPGWAAEGEVTIMPGNETDFDAIESDILDLCRPFQVVSAGFDPWQSAQMAQRLRGEGVIVLEFRATTQNFSPAILELDAAMRAGRLRDDGNPVLDWCMGNVVGKPDGRGNL